MKASVRKIVWNDWPALFAFAAIPTVWAIHFAFPYLRKSADAPVALALSLSVLAATVLSWRIARVFLLFAGGAVVEGIVQSVRIVTDRGLLKYSYSYSERQFVDWCPVHKSKQVLALRIGQTLSVLVDRQNPQKSIVADLFVKQ